MLAAGNGTIVAEFFDAGESRRLAWARRPQAAALVAALADPERGWRYLRGLRQRSAGRDRSRQRPWRLNSLGHTRLTYAPRISGLGDHGLDPRGGPQEPEDAHRMIGATAGQRTHCQQTRRIGPLQVIQADHQGPDQRQLLHQVGEGVYRAEPQARVAGHGDRPWSPAPGAASSPAMAARRWSGDDRAHPRAAASRPNGRVRSSSSARPAATCMPRPRASCRTAAAQLASERARADSLAVQVAALTAQVEELQRLLGKDSTLEQSGSPDNTVEAAIRHLQLSPAVITSLSSAVTHAAT